MVRAVVRLNVHMYKPGGPFSGKGGGVSNTSLLYKIMRCNQIRMHREVT